MWRLTISTPDAPAEQVELKPGISSIGRMSNNDIVIRDNAASRKHAEIHYDEASNVITLSDTGSTNGTFVNRSRVQGRVVLQHNDVIRIGQVVMMLTRDTANITSGQSPRGTHLLTRELVLESLDQHGVLLFNAMQKFNTITDSSEAIAETVTLLKNTLNLSQCEIIMAAQFNRLTDETVNGQIMRQSIRSRSAEVRANFMFVPVVAGNKSIALFALERPRNRPEFSNRDFQFAVAVSHQFSLVMQRLELIRHVYRQEHIQHLLRRFIAPQEADFLLRDYLRDGKLPELTERKATILFSDMADSTALAEQIGAREFGQLLSNYYQVATQIVFKYGGIVRYLGDGVMAVFVETPTAANHEERAVRAGLEIVERIESANRQGDSAHHYIMGVAINTGVAVIGYVGTEERAEFAALGDPVNVAYRMQSFSRPYRVVIGPATMAAIVGKFETRRIGETSLRGRSKPVQVYEVLRTLEPAI